MPSAVEEARDTGARGVSRFLAAHEVCASDFEFRRLHGRDRGRLRLICNGCGEGAAYDADDPGAVRAAAAAPRESGSSPPPPRRRDLERWLPAPAALPSWVPSAYILVVIAVGLGMIAFGLLGSGRDDPAVLGGGEAAEQPAGATTPAPDDGRRSEPKSAPPVAAQPAEIPRPSGASRSPGKAKRGGRPASEPGLDRVTVLDRFRIGVPEGWLKGTAGGAVVFRATGGAQVRVFLEPGGDRLRRLARQARSFLASEHPSAKVDSPRSRRLGGNKALELTARWPRGVERATVLSRSGFSYLLLARVEEGAPASVRRQALGALASFRAL